MIPKPFPLDRGIANGTKDLVLSGSVVNEVVHCNLVLAQRTVHLVDIGMLSSEVGHQGLMLFFYTSLKG